MHMAALSEQVASFNDNTDAYSRYILDEAEATHIQVFLSSILPGVLQTPEVARAVVRAYRPDADEALIATVVQSRAERHAQLLRQGVPATYFIDERVLLTPPENVDWQAQLRHLYEAASHPLISVRMIPAETLHTAQDMTTLLDLPEGKRSVYVESSILGDTYTSDPEISAKADVMFEDLGHVALNEAATLGTIRHLIEA